MASSVTPESFSLHHLLRRCPPRALIGGSAIVSGLVSIFFFFPRFWLWRGIGIAPTDLLSIEPELHRAFFSLQQLQNPWQRIDDVTNRVIEWRLWWPVVAHDLHLPAGVYLALPHLGCALTLASTAFFIWRATADAATTAAATMLAATLSWFFVSTGWLAYFDSWLMLGLVLASFSSSRRILFGAALLAPWIDERFILALPLCLGVRSLAADGATPRDPRTLWGDAGALLAGIAPYVAVRLGAELTHARTTSSSYWAQRSLLPASPVVMLIGAWHGLRLGWIAVAVGLGVTFRDRRAGRWLAAAAIFASLAVNLCIADDLSRSASIAFPVLVAGIILAWQAQPDLTARVLPLICLGNLLLPAAHIIAKPANDDETYHRAPILYAYAEFDRAQLQPVFANPAAYNSLGLDAFRAGDQTRALTLFNIALQFDPGFAKARANRGLLLFVTGHRPEGMADLDQALRERPALDDARLERAGFREQLGDVAGALADVRDALRRAPPDWPRRHEAAESERALAAKAALAPPH